MKTRAHNFIDLTGLTFGGLTVLNISHAKKKEVFWNCQCICGNQKAINGNSLRQGHTKSCGCLKHRKIPKGFSSMNRIFKQYQRGAKNRNYIFELSIDEFNDFTQQDCHYCGSSPMKTQINNCIDMTQEAKDYGKYTYNGLDRVDNSIGYVLSNVVPCCFICNRAKGSLSYESFIEYIQRIKEKK